MLGAAGETLVERGWQHGVMHEPAPVSPDARARVESLLAVAATSPGTPVDLDGVPGDPAAVAAAVDPDRLMADVRALAGSPRGNATDTAAALAAARYAEERLAALALHPQRLTAEHAGVRLPVIRCVVLGADPPGPAVVLVAHYDTVPGSPGADDNASGVAGLLEIARVLPRQTLPVSVVLAVVPFEESFGFAGSEALAAHLDQDPAVDVLAAISAEMLGFATGEPRLAGDRGDELFVVGYPGTEQVVDVLLAAAARWSPGRLRGLAAPVPVPEVGRSDHSSFHRRGVPAVMATDGAEFRNPHYHRPTETAETLSPEFLAGSTASLAVGLMALAAVRRG